MRFNPRPGIVIALVGISLLLRPGSSLAQEEGRRAVVHDQGVEAPDATHTEEGRRIEEDRRGGRDGSEETRSSRPRTEVEKVSRESDLTKGKDAEVHDLKTLRAETKADEAQANGFHDADHLSMQLMALRNEKGNFGLGFGTHEDADRLGREWVGENAKWSSGGEALVSADGLRQYRPPEFKDKLGREQANYERKLDPSDKKWISNAHLDIAP